jgi:hypothetical protein
MRRHLAALCLFCAVAGPALTPVVGQNLLDQVPTDSVLVRGSFTQLANCVYQRIDETGLKKVDLANESRLALESGGVRYWQLTLTPAQPGFTKADLTRAQTIFGPHPAPKVMPAVQACAAQ